MDTSSLPTTDVSTERTQSARLTEGTVPCYRTGDFPSLDWKGSSARADLPITQAALSSTMDSSSLEVSAQSGHTTVGPLQQFIE